MILLKMPSRDRGPKCLEVLKQYHDLAANKDQVKFLVSLDHDDDTITKEIIHEITKFAMIVVDSSHSKIQACNRDIKKIKEWDILVLASDDMIPVQEGWDTILEVQMKAHYPDTDGVLFFNDGYSALNTMCILGKKYYDRFGYIYHPDYISLWCDNHFMEVADILERQTRFDQVLFRHEHWANNSTVEKDPSYILNDKFYSIDKETYDKHKANNFGL